MPPSFAIRLPETVPFKISHIHITMLNYFEN